MGTLRQHALKVLQTADPWLKATCAAGLSDQLPIDADAVLCEPVGLPARPAKPALVPHNKIKQRSIATAEGIAALLHSIAHIELNAIDLAADACWRFEGMPDQYYRDWAQVAREEAVHFGLLSERLRELGRRYGDFDAHNSLWDMAERTKHDVLSRMALVPRTLEARGLDASPAVRAKFIGVGDLKAASIIDVILRDEIGHVAIGNRWFAHLCVERGLDPVSIYSQLAKEHNAPKLRRPFNLDARRAAGFTEVELDRLE